jgi:hypothetical protein
MYGVVPRFLLGSALALALALLLVISGNPLAAAAVPQTTESDTGETTVVWAARPADASGPDGRRWVEQELDPGRSATDYLAVTNFGDARASFEVTAADGYFTDAGRFSILAPGAESTGAGQWISVDPAVTVDAGQTSIIPFTITVPADATPGDHAAGIAVSVSASSDASGAAMSVDSRLGFRVMIRVAGDVAPALEVSSTAVYDTSWQPHRPGIAVVRVTARNSGNVRVAVSPHVAWDGTSHMAAANGDPVAELLPGDARTFEIRVPDVWPLGWQSLPVVIDQSLVLPDREVQDLESVHHATGVWALPWPQLLVLLGVALLVMGLARVQRRRGERVRLLIEEAHQRGRREAIVSDSR